MPVPAAHLAGHPPSLRILRKNPAFTIAAIGTLALGIVANTAIFQLLDAVRLRSLPVPNPQELARIQFPGGNKELFGTVGYLYALTYPQCRRAPPQ